MSIGNDIKNKKLSSMPIPVGQPIEISVDQNTGELVISFYQLLSNDQTLQMSLVLEPAAALQLLSSSHEIERVYGELISSKAKQHSLQ